MTQKQEKQKYLRAIILKQQDFGKINISNAIILNGDINQVILQEFDVKLI